MNMSINGSLVTNKIAGNGFTRAEVLGDILKRFRLERHLSVKDVADRVACKSKRVHDFESGKDVPDARVWARYANLVAKGLRGYDSEWHLALTERRSLGTPPAASAETASHSVDLISKYEAKDAVAESTITAAPLPDVASLHSFPEALHAARLLTGLGTDEIGELVGVHRDSIINWETGRVKPVLDNLEKLISLMPDLSKWRTAGIAKDIPKPAGFPRELRDNQNGVAPAGLTTIREIVMSEEFRKSSAASTLASADEKQVGVASRRTAGAAIVATMLAQDAALAKAITVILPPDSIAEPGQVKAAPPSVETLGAAYMALVAKRRDAKKALSEALKTYQDMQNVVYGLDTEVLRARTAFEDAADRE